MLFDFSMRIDMKAQSLFRKSYKYYIPIDHMVLKLKQRLLSHRLFHIYYVLHSVLQFIDPLQVTILIINLKSG